MPQPLVWNIGMKFAHTESGRVLVRRAKKRALLVSDRCDSTAPFGKPVVPEVYWICAASPGATAGSADGRSPVRNRASGLSRSTISRTASSPSAAAAPISAIGLPRWLATENRAEAPDCSRT